MSEMVERVAAALCEAQVGLLNGWGNTPEWRRNVLRNDARAAIAAMREPTEAMIDAYVAAGDAKRPMEDICRERWRAMIDAALKEIWVWVF